LRTVKRIPIPALPNAGVPVEVEQYPRLNQADYLARFERAKTMMDGLSHLVVYADREHFANIEFFTGFDPRFEEALFILPKEGEATILVGNEGKDYAEAILPPMRKVLYSPFSLPGQPRGQVVTLQQLLSEAGLDASARVGLIGWKLFTADDGLPAERTFDVPHFIFQALRALVKEEHIVNATSLMVGNQAGLRLSLDDKELLLGEITGTLVSRSIHNVLANLKEGMSELEASEHFLMNGLPQTIHPNLNFGRQLSYAIASPTPHNRLKAGDVVGLGMAYRRALCHKVGYFIGSAAEEPAGLAAFQDTYFRSVAAWYEAVKIGATGGSVYRAVEAVTGPLPQFGIGLNPGHLIHTDEWTNTPFTPGNEDSLRSGMMIQCDYSAYHPESGFVAHAEDGILLADAPTRDRLRAASPAAWSRIQARRDFMMNTLHIRLAEEVLPTSDMPGIVYPYLRNLGIVLAFEP